MNIPETIQLLNRIYAPLEARRSTLAQALTQAGFSISSGYYNGHYTQSADGTYTKDAHPIPVLSIDGLCDIEIGLSTLSLSTKLPREVALTFDYTKLSPYPFEAYGVEDYLSDYCHPGMTPDQLRANIRASSETAIGFSFPLTNAPDQTILSLVTLLQAEGFFC